MTDDGEIKSIMKYRIVFFVDGLGNEGFALLKTFRHLNYEEVRELVGQEVITGGRILTKAEFYAYQAMMEWVSRKREAGVGQGDNS